MNIDQDIRCLLLTTTTIGALAVVDVEDAEDERDDET